MKARDTLSYSFGAIRLRKLRSGLTTLGIVVGIAAIVALLSFTQGFQVAISGQFQEGLWTPKGFLDNRRIYATPDEFKEKMGYYHPNDPRAKPGKVKSKPF